MTPQEIYPVLRAGGMTRAGALGTIGNFMAEAGPDLNPQAVEIGRSKLSNAQYTRAADEGRIDFVNDRIGFGLAQFTAPDRKGWLQNFARQTGRSVGDGMMQLEYVLWEMPEKFPLVWEKVTTSDDLEACCDLVCRSYEMPATNNYIQRRMYAWQASNATQGMDPAEPEPVVEPPADDWDGTVASLQVCMAHDGYWPRDQITGVKTQEFREKIKEYAADVAAC